THRIGVYGGLRMIAITLLRGGGGSPYEDRGRARRVHGGADLSTGRRSLPIQSTERFCWTNAAVLDTVTWAKAAVSASKPSDREVPKGSDTASPHGNDPIHDLLRTHVRRGRIGIDVPDRGGVFCSGGNRDRADCL